MTNGEPRSAAAASIPSPPSRRPTMPELVPGYSRRGLSVALALACLFVVTIPYHHLLSLRTTALGLAALVTFVSGGWRELTRLPLKTAWWAWIIVAAISVWYARDPAFSFGEYRHEVLYAFGAWATCYTLARRRDGARWIGRALIVSTLATLGVGVALFAAGQAWFDLGSYGDVGTVSTFFVMVLPVFLLFALRSPPHSPRRIGALVVAAACVGAGSLTLNRTFAIAVAAEITIFALFSMRYWNSRFRTASMVGVGAIVAALAVAQVLTASESRIALTAPGTDVRAFLSEDPRGELWRFAVARIAEHPWLGAGIGKATSSGVFLAHFGDPMLSHAHNTFLNRALETGLPGLAAFVFLIAAVAIAFGRVARSGDAGTAAIGAAGVALVVGVVVKNLTDDFFVRQGALLFWALAGAGLGTAAARDAAAKSAAPA